MTTHPIELHLLDLDYAELRITDEARVGRLAADLGGEGQRQPVLVVARGDRFVLIDGHVRVAALKRLGRDTVHAICLPMTEPEALLFAWRTRVGRRRFPLEEAWLLQALIERHSLRQADLARRLGRSPAFVSRRLALVRQLPEAIQKAVQKGRICAAAAEKYLVPLSRCNGDHAVRLVANLADLRPTMRQIGALYQAWRVADRETRERIVDYPLLFLKVDQHADPPADDPLGDLVRSLEAIAGASARSRKVLRAATLHQLAGDARSAVVGAFREAELAFASVRSVLAEENLDA